MVLVKSRRVLELASHGRLGIHSPKGDWLSPIGGGGSSMEQKEKVGGGTQQQHQGVDPLWCLVGHVEYGRRCLEDLRVIVSRQRWVTICTAGNSGKKGEALVLLKLGGNVTAMREFSALCRASSIPLLQDLLGKKLGGSRPKEGEGKGPKLTRSLSSDSLSSGDEDSDCKFAAARIEKRKLLQKMGGDAALGEGFTRYAAAKFNPSQLGAISAASSEYGKGGFTLVKGPPGTGKVCLVLLTI